MGRWPASRFRSLYRSLRRSLRASVAVVVSTCLVLTALSASAAEPVGDFVALPFRGYGDMLVDAAHDRVFVTGGSGHNSVAVVSLDGSGVTLLSDLPGATSLSMTADGRFVYVSLRQGDGIAEIDTETLATRRISTGRNTCPTQVAANAGYVWYVEGGDQCNQWQRIRRLDPATGTVSPEVISNILFEPVLRAVPGTSRLLYVETRLTPGPEAGVFDVADGTLREVTSGRIGDGENAQLTTDSTHLMVKRDGQVNFYRVTDLALDGVIKLPTQWRPHAFSADSQIVAVESGSSEVTVFRRDTNERVKTLDLGPEGTPAVVAGLRLVGDRLLAATVRDGALRLYQVDLTTAPAPDLTLVAPAQSYVGRSVSVSGTLTSPDAPIAGATVTLRQEGVEQPLASLTTDADGRYSYELTPVRAGDLRISTHYAGDGQHPAAVARATVSVVRRPVTLTLGAPSSVWPDELVTLSGALFDGTAPMGGTTLDVQRRCPNASWELVATVVTGVDGTYAATDTPGPCSSYDYRVSYDGDSELAAASAEARVLVSWLQPVIDLHAPAAAHVGDTVDIAGTLSTPDAPVAGAQLTVRVETPSGWRSVGTVTTDDTGAFATSDEPSVAGSHCYRVTYAGGTRQRSASAGRCVGVTARATSLTLSGPAEARLDDPVTVVGRLTVEGQSPAGVELVVSRTDRFLGAQSLSPVTTGPNGDFTFTDVPPNGSVVTYAVSHAGTQSQAPASATWTVDVHRPERSLTLRTDRAVYGYGQIAHVEISLVTHSLRWVRVYAQEAGRTKSLIFSGEVPADTGVTLQRPMRRNTTFRAFIAEDGRAQPASVSLDRLTRAGLETKALGGYGTSGRYRLYRPSADPSFAATINPARDTGCLAFQVQRQYSTGWRTTSTATCVAIGDLSTAAWKLTGTQAPKTPYRVRSKFAGDDINAPGTGAWVYFKFV